MGRGRRSRRVCVAVAGVLGLLVALTGCLRHDQFTVAQPRESGLVVHSVSGDGRFVVVEALTGNDAVPFAGWWRINRQTGATISLPGPAGGISADGRRVLLQDGSLWRPFHPLDTYPADRVFSPDLSAWATIEYGKVVARSIDTGEVTFAEDAFPRPAGSTGARVVAVSDDGRTVAYVLFGDPGVTRVARQGIATPIDSPGVASLAADGSSFVRLDTTYTSRIDPISGNEVVNIAATERFEVVAFPSGAVISSVTRDMEVSQDYLSWKQAYLLAAPGHLDRVWLVEVDWVRDGARCGWATPTVGKTCRAASRLLVLSAGELKTHEFGTRPIWSADVSADGVYLVLGVDPDGIATPYADPPVVMMAGLGEIEVLDQGVEDTSTDAAMCAAAGQPSTPCTITRNGTDVLMSDDGRLIIARPMYDSGWYEFEDPVEEG